MRSNLKDTFQKRRRLIFILLAMLVVAALAFVLNDYIKESIAPGLLSWMWSVWVMSSGFPQVMTWAFFVAAIPVIAIFSLVQTRPSFEESPDQEEPQTPGQVRMMAQWLGQAHQGEYFRLRLVRHLSNLALNVLEYRHRIVSKEIRELVENGQLNVDGDIREYLRTGWRKRAGIMTYAETRRARLSRMAKSRAGRDRAPWRDPLTEKVVRFLETELEVDGES